VLPPGEDARRSLAAFLTAAVPGDRLPTVRELAREMAISVGTVHRLLHDFEVEGAISVDRHGRNGAVLLSRTIGKLVDAARGGPLVLAVPLPTTPRTAGLATAIKASFDAAGIEADMSFYWGSRPRLEALRRRRADVAVMSALAAAERTSEETTALELPAGTYVLDHRVYFTRVDGPGQPLRVAFDRDSIDLQRMAQLEFEDAKPEFVPSRFTQFLRLLSDGDINAAIWNVNEPISGPLPPSIESRAISARVLDKLGGANTRVTFLTRTEDHLTQSVLRSCLRVPELLRIQTEVMNGDRVPEY
jgi:YhfZ-like protein/helix-turn-helix protein